MNISNASRVQPHVSLTIKLLLSSTTENITTFATAHSPISKMLTCFEGANYKYFESK